MIIKYKEKTIEILNKNGIIIENVTNASTLPYQPYRETDDARPLNIKQAKINVSCHKQNLKLVSSYVYDSTVVISIYIDVLATTGYQNILDDLIELVQESLLGNIEFVSQFKCIEKVITDIGYKDAGAENYAAAHIQFWCETRIKFEPKLDTSVDIHTIYMYHLAEDGNGNYQLSGASAVHK